MRPKNPLRFQDSAGNSVTPSSVTVPDGSIVGQSVTLSGGGGGGVITVADAAARFALTGLGRLATVYQEDNGFYYQLTKFDTGVLVAGAGTAAANGLYTERGTENGRPYYNLVGTPDNPSESSIFWGGDAWRIRAANSDTLYANGDEDVAFPWLSATWNVNSGDSPAPTVTQVANPEQTPSNWSALPKVYSANFWIDASGTPVVVVTREDNQTGVGVTLSYNNTGIVDVAADAPLFSEYSQVWCQLSGAANSNPITTGITIGGNDTAVISGFDDGTPSNAIFGGGGTSTTALEIRAYPEPD